MDIFLVFQRPLHWLITSLTDATLSYGLAIILFTIIIRTILAPLYVIQIRSSRKMVELSPRLKELQKKHGKDRESLTRETMALYREYNHNPALGCVLPLLQLPILWSLFLVLRNLAKTPHELVAQHVVDAGHAALYSAHFLWLDLGKPDSLHVLPIVAGITQWIQQRMMLQPSNDAQQRQMNQIMQFLPLMIVVFAWAYPSGLAVYWVTSNIFMMIMQYFISGWGQLFTSPLSVPYASNTVVARPPTPRSPGTPPTPPASGLAGFLARALTPPARDTSNGRPARNDTAKQTPNGRTPRSETTRDAAPTEESAANGTGDETISKMERYAARHGRGASRGRPSAKGAKK